jgi:hypothetical protein
MLGAGTKGLLDRSFTGRVITGKNLRRVFTIVSKATPMNDEPMDLSTTFTTNMSKNTMRKLGLWFICKKEGHQQRDCQQGQGKDPLENSKDKSS